MGLFENPYTDRRTFPAHGDVAALDVAHNAAEASVVLLKNERDLLPLEQNALRSLAVIGPLADAPRDQLGTWIFDGDPGLSVTPLRALEELLGDSVDVQYVKALATSRSRDTAGFDDALKAAAAADAVVLMLGEEAILSGEAHSRADIGLPGAQAELVQKLATLGKPLVGVIQTGRPLTLTNVVDDLDAILFAGHLGTMAGPAIANLLLGIAEPAGRLPATLPRMVGQIPIYYAQKNTGKPPSPETAVLIDAIDADAEQLSTGMTAYHLDAGYTPLFPFGYGLTYTRFGYHDVKLSTNELRAGETLTISVELTNEGRRIGTETVQLYLRDVVGSVTRPVRELKGFRRVRLEPGARTRVRFEITTDDLAFYGRSHQLGVEPGEFQVFVGGDANAEYAASFRFVA